MNINNNSKPIDDIDEPLLRVQGLKTYFRTSEGLAKAVDDVSFEIRQGEIFALVGESGCGKSVTALSIIQLVPQPAGFIAGGKIYYKGKEITHLSEWEKRKIRGNEISMIFQEPMTSLNPVLKIGEQIVEAIKLHQGFSGAQASQKAIEMLERVGIPEPKQRFHEYSHQLSGGMKQRVMIAIALSCQPGLLIADEPTTALDVTIQAEILELIRQLQREFGTAVLLITHDLGVVAEMANRIAVMYAGKIVELAERRRLFQNPYHPYTVRLIESLPSRQKRGYSLMTIEGRVPKATRYPEGCRFAARCHRVMQGCSDILPRLLEIEPNHQVACHLYDEAYASRVKHATVREALRKQALSSSQETLLIEVRGLRVYFPIKKGLLKKTVGYVKAVDGVDLIIRKGQIFALVGESGCGKTTFGKGLLQLVPPYTPRRRGEKWGGGEVRYDGVDLTKLSRNELHPYRRKLQIIFQDPYSSLNPRMMVGNIIQEGMAAHGIGANQKEREERIQTLMPQVGLDPDMIHRYPHEFSGGQRQRIGIARCLAVNPEFLVCDEATSSLDVSVQAQILNLLEQLQKEYDLTYLFITHNLSLVEYLADEVAVMYLGRIVERGKTEEIFDTPRHPYTRALLSVIPQIDPQTGRKTIRLSGDVPSPINPPAGCHFHPRCSEAMPRCQKAYPDEVVITSTHACRCFL
jgi:peptide/nickel transport system ATP-binding protein